MRIEATVPDSRGTAVKELADQLGMSRSQIIDEALSLFLKAVLEVRRGRRLVTQDSEGREVVCELTTPTLTTLEWVLTSHQLDLPEEAIEKIQKLLDAPTGPGPRLREAAKRHG